MHIQPSLLPVAFVALSMSLVTVVDAAPVKQLIKREVGNIIEARGEVPAVAEPQQRNVVIKRGYYVGQRKPSSPPAMVRRDRFAPYGYPVSVVRRDSDKHPSVSASNDDDNDGNAPANTTTTQPPPPPKPATPQNATQSTVKADTSNNTVTLPKGVTATSNGFLFIPVSQQVPATATNNATSTGSQSAQPSVTRQTFYINIEAAQGGTGQTFKLDTVSGGGAKSENATANNGGAAKQASNKSSDGGDNDDDSASKGKKPSTPSSSASSPSGGNSTANDDGVKKIIFKPLQDPDGGSSNKVVSPNVKAADAAETQDLKDVSNGDDKASSGKNGSSGDGSGAKSGSSGPSSPAPAPASNSKPALPAASNTSSSTNSSSSSGDNYFLFPVDKDKQQVDLSKGDMIAYVEHPQSAAKNMTQQRRDVPSSEEAEYRRQAQGGGVRNGNVDFTRRAKEFFKRNLVSGKPGVTPEYWRGQKYEKQENRPRSEGENVRRDTLVFDDGDIVLKRSSRFIGDGQQVEPGFILIRRAPQESLEEAERRYLR